MRAKATVWGGGLEDVAREIMHLSWMRPHQWPLPGGTQQLLPCLPAWTSLKTISCITGLPACRSRHLRRTSALHLHPACRSLRMCGRSTQLLVSCLMLSGRPAHLPCPPSALPAAASTCVGTIESRSVTVPIVDIQPALKKPTNFYYAATCKVGRAGCWVAGVLVQAEGGGARGSLLAWSCPGCPHPGLSFPSFSGMLLLLLPYPSQAIHHEDKLVECCSGVLMLRCAALCCRAAPASWQPCRAAPCTTVPPASTQRPPAVLQLALMVDPCHLLLAEDGLRFFVQVCVCVWAGGLVGRWAGGQTIGVFMCVNSGMGCTTTGMSLLNRLQYDQLCISTGSQGSTFGIPGVEQHTHFLR